MRHRKRTVKLGRTSAHRNATLASIVCGLISEKRVKTTVAKAKAARSLADKMVTLGKDGSLAARRRAIARLRRKELVAQLFDDIAPTFADRAGGYTRIIKLGCRPGDNAELAILEWVEGETGEKKKGKKKSGKKGRKEASSKKGAKEETKADEKKDDEEKSE